MFVKVYFINMHSDLNINDFMKDKKWHEQGALLFQSGDLLILVQKSRLQIFQIESGNIFSENELFFCIKENLRLLNWASLIDICHGL